MTGRKHERAVRSLVALVAALFSVAVLALTTGHPQAPVRDKALGPSGFGMADIGEEAATVTSTSAAAVLTPATVPPHSPVTTTVFRRSVTTIIAPTVTRQPTSPFLPSTPPSTTTVTAVRRTSSWSASQNGISLRMRMEPTAAQAGEPVTFFVELSPIDSCCIGALDFGETGAPLALEARCSYSPAAVLKAAATHTFARSGAYKVVASVATVPCSVPSPTGDGSLTVTGFPVGVNLEACVVIGPSTADCAP